MYRCVKCNIRTAEKNPDCIVGCQGQHLMEIATIHWLAPCQGGQLGATIVTSSSDFSSPDAKTTHPSTGRYRKILCQRKPISELVGPEFHFTTEYKNVTCPRCLRIAKLMHRK